MCLNCRDEAPALLWAGLQLGAAVDALCAGGARVVVSVSVCCLPYNCRFVVWEVPELQLLLWAACINSLSLLQECAACGMTQ